VVQERGGMLFWQKFWSRNGATVNGAAVQRSGISAHTKFGQLVLRKTIEIVATRCHILLLKYTKFDFCWGGSQTPLGEVTALPQPPSWI